MITNTQQLDRNLQLYRQITRLYNRTTSAWYRCTIDGFTYKDSSGFDKAITFNAISFMGIKVHTNTLVEWVLFISLNTLNKVEILVVDKNHINMSIEDPLWDEHNYDVSYVGTIPQSNKSMEQRLLDSIEGIHRGYLAAALPADITSGKDKLLWMD